MLQCSFWILAIQSRYVEILLQFDLFGWLANCILQVASRDKVLTFLLGKTMHLLACCSITGTLLLASYLSELPTKTLWNSMNIRQFPLHM